MGGLDHESTQALLAELRRNFEFYAASNLSILDKSGSATRLVFNRAQQYVHERLEQQLRETGKVRALILKGRQQGISTYVGGRFYQKVSMIPGKRALIIAHEAKATSNLFNMVKRYDDHNPMAPSKSATNAQELIFGKLDAGYKVATAGSKDTGRSLTAQLFHGSEFAFWDNAQQHLAGIGNAVGDIDGTEIILESTGNGLGNAFHVLWQSAEAGIGEYIAIFVPWFWQDEYRAKVPADFELSAEDLKYQAAYGLDLEQMAWRKNKIVTYGAGFEWLFDQEYPATPSLAFQSPTSNPLITPTLAAQAMNNEFRERYGSFIIGCDPAEGVGKDRTAIAFRHGRTCFKIEAHPDLTPMQVVGRLATFWNELKPDALVVDKIGIGSGIYDRLIELRIPVIGINSGMAAERSDVYANKRAEMWWRMKEWLENAPCRIPNDMALLSDLAAPMGNKHTSNGLKLLESKQDMFKRGLRSPDLADSLALTFAVTVAPRDSDLPAQGPAQGSRPATKAGY